MALKVNCLRLELLEDRRCLAALQGNLSHAYLSDIGIDDANTSIVRNEAGQYDDARLHGSNSVTLEGTSDHISVGQVIANEAQAEADYLGFWVRFDQPIGSISRPQAILNVDRAFDGVYVGDWTSYVENEILSIGGLNWRFGWASPTATLDPGWHHVEFLIDGMNSKLFVDGIDRTTVIVGLPSELSLGNVNIGDRNDRLGKRSFNFDGQLAGLEFQTESETVFLLPLAEGDGNTFYDASGNGNHGEGINLTPEAWQNRQDVYHWNIAHGFTSAENLLESSTDLAGTGWNNIDVEITNGTDVTFQKVSPLSRIMAVIDQSVLAGETVTFTFKAKGDGANAINASLERHNGGDFESTSKRILLEDKFVEYSITHQFEQDHERIRVIIDNRFGELQDTVNLREMRVFRGHLQLPYFPTSGIPIVNTKIPGIPTTAMDAMGNAKTNPSGKYHKQR